MLGLIYSIASYVGFLIVYAYFAAFTDGVLVPKGVDDWAPGAVGTALAVDLGLMLLFGLQHSIMARASFKRALTCVIPASLERATFVLASSAALMLLMWYWLPLPTTLWSVESPKLAAALWVINVLGWVGVPVSTFMIDHFDLFGVKRAWSAFRRTSFERKGFVTPMFYKYVRHPMMTSLFVAFWVTPHMTIGHLFLSLGMSVYIFIGVHFEERSLIAELGSPYRRYRESTPKFVPVGSTALTLPEGPSSVPNSREVV